MKRELHHESCTPNVLHGCPLLRLIRSAEGAGRECGKDAMRKGWERNGEVKVVNDEGKVEVKSCLCSVGQSHKLRVVGNIVGGNLA